MKIRFSEPEPPRGVFNRAARDVAEFLNRISSGKVTWGSLGNPGDEWTGEMKPEPISPETGVRVLGCFTLLDPTG